jgi:tripartite-type tricarboxylate transporter receptor subunit TctC
VQNKLADDGWCGSIAEIKSAAQSRYDVRGQERAREASNVVIICTVTTFGEGTMKNSLHQAATPQRRSRAGVNNWPKPKTPSSGQHPRRRFLHLAAGAATLPTTTRFTWAQTYPVRPVTVIVPFAAGNPTDVTARVMAERMRGSLGQPVIIENVSGADESIGVGRVARARPDGYTIELGFLGGNVLNGAFYSLPYDVLNDFAPISPLVKGPLILFARKSLPAKDVNELIAWLKANPNKASVGNVALGNRLVAAFFQKETGTRFTLVPYRGTAAVMQDLVAGQIDLTFIQDPGLALPLVRAGSIKAYAVTSDTRLAIAPDIPTFGEMGLGNQVLISNHRKLLWSKAMVVNVAEKLERDSGRYD